MFSTVRLAPFAAAARNWPSASSRAAGGSRSDQSASCAAHDTDTVPAASAAASSGWAASRRIQPTFTAAARRVAWVCQVSHTRGDPCPSPAIPPPGTVNAPSTRACTAVCRDSATASARRQSACSPSGHPVTSAPARNSSAADSDLTASAASPGPAPVPGSAPGEPAPEEAEE